MRTITLGVMIAIVPLALFSLTSSVDAGRILDQTGTTCCCECPVCDHVCTLSVDSTDKERTCYEIETKVICIPRVVFPWQKKAKSACRDNCDACDGRGCQSCVHNGARLRRVKVAKAKKVTCPACKYTWTPEKKGCCGGCDNGGCAEAPVEKPVDISVGAPQPDLMPVTYREAAPEMLRQPEAGVTRLPAVQIAPATEPGGILLPDFGAAK